MMGTGKSKVANVDRDQDTASILDVKWEKL